MSIKVRSLAIGVLVAAALPAVFWLIAPHYEAVAYDAGSAPVAPEFTHRRADDSRARFIGETHSGTSKAKRIEAAIARLLAE